MKLEGRAAIVTGGTRGIGRAITARFLREGIAVAICGRSAASVQRSVEALASYSGKIRGIQADISRLADVERLFAFADQELGGVDILVNNAGIAVLRPTADMQTEEWERTLAVNLSSVFYCCRETIKRFRRHRGGGFIVNIGSLLGKTAVAGARLTAPRSSASMD